MNHRFWGFQCVRWPGFLLVGTALGGDRLTSEGSLVRTRLRPPGGLHVSPGPIFTFGSDISRCLGRPGWGWVFFTPGTIFGVLVCVADRHGRAAGWCRPGIGERALLGGCARGERRRRRVCYGGAAARSVSVCGAGAGCVAGDRLRLAGCCLPGGWCRRRVVAHDEQTGGEERDGGQAHEAAPAAGDVVAGGVFGPWPFPAQFAGADVNVSCR